MAGTAHWKAGWSTDLLGDRHRDEPRAPPGIPPASATDRGFAPIDCRGAQDRHRHPRSHDTEPPRWRPDDLAEANSPHRAAASAGRQHRAEIYGEGEWLDQKHGIRSRRRWRKLHLGVDAATHEIVAVELTPDDVGDIAELPHLLEQIDADVASMTADGAYDGQVVYDAVAERHPKAAVIVPPRITAVAGETTSTQRDNISRPLQSMGA